MGIFCFLFDSVVMFSSAVCFTLPTTYLIIWKIGGRNLINTPYLSSCVTMYMTFVMMPVHNFFFTLLFHNFIRMHNYRWR